jgi:hypothetical protein
MKIFTLVFLLLLNQSAFAAAKYTCSAPALEATLTLALEKDRVVQVIDETGEWVLIDSEPFLEKDGTFSDNFMISLQYGDAAGITVFFKNNVILKAEGYVRDDDYMTFSDIADLACVYEGEVDVIVE